MISNKKTHAHVVFFYQTKDYFFSHVNTLQKFETIAPNETFPTGTPILEPSAAP